MGEVIVTSSTKETNNLRTLPGSVSILSPQMISGRQIDALKDISSFVPNLYMPDYGAKLTSAIYIGFYRVVLVSLDVLGVYILQPQRT